MVMTKDEFYNLLESGENVPVLVNFCVDQPNNINLLMDIAISDSRKGTWRSMWVADKIHEQHPELILPFLEQMIEATKTMGDESKLRHLLKIISLNKVPEKHLSFLLDYSIQQLTNVDRTVAIRVHAMQILFQISVQEPDFKPELIQLIEHEMEYHATGGIQARGRQLLKKLKNAETYQNPMR